MDQCKLSDNLKAFLTAFQKPTHNFRLGCSEDGGDLYMLDLLSAYDVMRECGVSTGHKQKLSKYKLLTGAVTVQTAIRAKWQDGTLMVSFGLIVPMITLENAKSLVCYLLRRNAKSQDEVKQLLEYFDIPQSQFESSIVSQPERDTIGMVQRAIPFESLPQFNLGEYRIDLYIPELNVCVECDEDNHVSYDSGNEMKRYNFIRKHLGCEIIRFDPYATNFSVCDVIRTLIEMILARKSIGAGPKEEKECNQCKQHTQTTNCG
jgi:hypothetical protein